MYETCFRDAYHALFGKTRGYYGPYVWKDTVSAVYSVELPDGTAQYTVNILKGFVFRSRMDYLTFGRFGTGGWASPDGTINCIAQKGDRLSMKDRAYIAIDLKSFYASVECRERGRDPGIHKNAASKLRGQHCYALFGLALASIHSVMDMLSGVTSHSRYRIWTPAALASANAVPNSGWVVMFGSTCRTFGMAMTKAI